MQDKEKPKWNTIARLSGDLMGATGRDDAKSRNYRQAGAVVMAGFIVGPNVKRICKWSKYPRKRVMRYAQRLWEQGIWHRGKIIMDESETPGSRDVELVLFGLVATGMISKYPSGLDLYRRRIIELMKEHLIPTKEQEDAGP